MLWPSHQCPRLLRVSPTNCSQAQVHLILCFEESTNQFVEKKEKLKKRRNPEQLAPAHQGARELARLMTVLADSH